MSSFQSFSEGAIEGIARLLGECGSGSDISRVLSARGILDDSEESTKWRRLYKIFLNSQKQHSCSNVIVDFIQSFLIPSRFVGRSEIFEKNRQELNAILAFEGLEYGEDGKFRTRTVVTTLSEAEKSGIFQESWPLSLTFN